MKTLASALIVASLASTAVAADPPAAPSYTIILGPRTACATPMTAKQARAEGGVTDVTLPSSNVLGMSMSGSVAANAFLGQTSAATETFHLEQEFTIECSDPAVTTARLTLDSALVGFVRSKYKAGACVRMAAARLCVAGVADTPLVVVHPPQRVEGDNARLCNQHLPPVRVDGMPLGRYILAADFVITSDAGGLHDGHSAADFSPSTALPTDWVRTRDPFQGVDKKDFGFKVLVTADPPDSGKDKAVAVAPARAKDVAIARASAAARAVPARPRVATTGLDRHSGPR